MRALLLLTVAAGCEAGPTAAGPPAERVVAFDACVDDVVWYLNRTIVRTRGGVPVAISAAGPLEQVAIAHPSPETIPPRHSEYVTGTVDHDGGTIVMTDEHARRLGRYTFPTASCVVGLAALRWWDVDAVIVAMDFKVAPTCREPVIDPCALVVLPAPKDLPTRDEALPDQAGTRRAITSSVSASGFQIPSSSRAYVPSER